MRSGFSNIRLILTGVIINSFFSAFILLITSLAGEKLSRIVLFLLGNVTVPSVSVIGMFYFAVITAFLFFILFSRYLDIISIEDLRGKDYGIDVIKLKKILILVSSLIIGIIISYSGIIGFVGLIIPHILRLILGPAHKRLLLYGFFTGGFFLIAADTISRQVISPEFLPVGVITALIGAPVFIFLIYRGRFYRGY